MGEDWQREMKYILDDSLKKKTIVVIDNGTQYGLLYVKRLKDLGINVHSIDAGVYTDEKGKIVRRRVSLEELIGFAGVVVAGGRSSVIDEESKRVDIDPRIYKEFPEPILGTCFGHQDMADRLGGRVVNYLKQ